MEDTLKIPEWSVGDQDITDSIHQGRFIFVNRFFFPDHSATSQLLSDLAFELATSGGNIHVITSRQRYDQSELLPARESIRGVQVHRVWSSMFGRRVLLLRAFDYLSFYLSAGLQLLKLTLQGDVIIAKTDPPMISVIAWLIAQWKGARLINWLQDLYPEVAIALNIQGVKQFGEILRFLRNLSLQYSQTSVVLGEKMAQYLEREGIKRGNIAVINNWSVGDGISPIDREQNTLRQEWGLKGKFVIGYSGNMGRVHDFETIIAAVRRLSEKTRDIIFIFIGGGAKQSLIEKELAALPNVLFKPYQPLNRLSQSLSVADVHLVSLLPAMEGKVIPSKFYGIAAAGRPAVFVGDPEGDIARIIREEDCGYVVPSGQVESLVACLDNASKNSEEILLKGQRIRNVFERRFTREIAMASWRKLLFQDK